ncbi:hypothetical protein CLCR_03736 [Cladophialophora carrionii]|uniref:Uncharacterized protein n=1 Tax=Cladophialophora carrionii TaxID=86049 RepID=A0A1C1CFY5_9EURO|nr:hypothetical protein CLCR_03736 [Cladophialophora carrionii]
MVGFTGAVLPPKFVPPTFQLARIEIAGVTLEESTQITALSVYCLGIVATALMAFSDTNCKIVLGALHFCRRTLTSVIQSSMPGNIAASWWKGVGPSMVERSTCMTASSADDEFQPVVSAMRLSQGHLTVAQKHFVRPFRFISPKLQPQRLVR